VLPCIATVYHLPLFFSSFLSFPSSSKKVTSLISYMFPFTGVPTLII